MGLKFKGQWRFRPPADDGTLYHRKIPDAAVEEAIDLIKKVATQGNRQEVLEHFKSAFGRSTGVSTSRSSSESWAETDLRGYAYQAAENAPLFIEAFYDACQSFVDGDADLFAPDEAMINALLERHGIGYEIRPPRLILRGAELDTPVATSPSSSVIPPAIERPAASQQYEYDVALSFAGEDRTYVEEVANQLKAAGVRVFYDFFEKATLWGKNLADHLSDVYGKRSQFVVIFVSEHYARKAWPTHERQSAQARAIRENAVVLLPARFDNTEVPGLPSTVGYIDLQSTESSELVEIIIAKLHSA